MILQGKSKDRTRLILTAILVVNVAFALMPVLVHAQNLGGAPAFDKTVQGQTAGQPEGTLLNLVNFVGNVLCPLGAAVFVVAALVSYVQGRGAARWAITAVGLLMISGLTRLLESWVSNGGAGVR
jgi:hypothetical protein